MCPLVPYALTLAIRGQSRAWCLNLATEAVDPGGAVLDVAGPVRQVVKDYCQICASYYDRSKPCRSKDRRRLIGPARHPTEGARVLQGASWEGKAEG